MRSRLIAAGHARQVEAVVRADAAANAAERAVHAVWRELLRLLKVSTAEGYAPEKWKRIRLLLAALVPRTIAAAAKALHGIGRWGWRSAAQAAVRHVPRRLLAVAASKRQLRRGTQLTEDEGTESPDWLDLLFPFRDKPLSETDWLGMLFPAPSEADISSVVYSSGWARRFAAGTRLGGPLQLADLLISGLAQGKSQQEIAKDLLPHVDSVRASARRIARTEGMRIANAMQMDCHRELGDLVIGHQIHSTPNPHSRPWHQKRSGTVYYVNPKPGQKGLRQMPNPPDEAEDESERPPGTPSTAWS